MNTTICHHLIEAQSRNFKQSALKFKHRGVWNSLNWTEYFAQVQALAAALSQKGLKAGDRLAIMSCSRYEWTLFDMATMSLGAITVPIYESTTPQDLSYILDDCKPKVLVLEDRRQLDKWLGLNSKAEFVEHIILFECGTTDNFPQKAVGLQTLLKEDPKGEDKNFNLKAHIDGLQTHVTATIIYTSGTTGSPKGVVLTHAQIMSEVSDAFASMGVDEKDVSLTFLPLAHVLGRVEHWGSIYWGYTLAFAESIERLRANLNEIKPTILVAVPRIFEKIHSTVSAQIQNRPPWEKHLFQQALKLGKSSSRYKMERTPLPLYQLPLQLAAEKWILKSVAEAFGGRLRFAVCGGAPLNPALAEFFHACGVLILEGYGLTETTAAITVNTPFAYRFGTVGKAIGDVEIRIAEDGEILVRSQKVMTEYYGLPEATSQVIDSEGFLATGDVGELSPDGFLRITDRKKDLIKTSGGKYVAPQKLEGLLKLNPLIGNVLIHGDKRKFVIALITLNEPTAAAFAREQNISFQNFEALSQHPKIHEQIAAAVDRANSQLASYESIKKFAVLPHDFSIERGELTPSLKVKRSVCDERYKDIIDGLYKNLT